MQCSKCGKPCTNGTGLAAHERRCSVGEGLDVVPDAPEPAAPAPAGPRRDILTMKAYTAFEENGEYRVRNNLGAIIGTFPTEIDAIRFVEGSNRWQR